MVSFSLFAFLVATATATATASTTANRRLSYALIAGYEPGSSVTDHVSISTVTVVPAFLVPSSLGCRFAAGRGVPVRCTRSIRARENSRPTSRSLGEEASTEIDTLGSASLCHFSVGRSISSRTAGTTRRKEKSAASDDHRYYQRLGNLFEQQKRRGWRKTRSIGRSLDGDSFDCSISFIAETNFSLCMFFIFVFSLCLSSHHP